VRRWPAAVLAGALCLGPSAKVLADPGALRVALFSSAGFPSVDAPVLDAAAVSQALQQQTVTTLGSPAELGARLRRADFDALILPYGSAFPLEAWPAIRDFLRQGGSLVVLGGEPFAQPVRLVDGRYALATRQPTFAHDLLIGPADRIARDDIAGPTTVVAVAGSGWEHVVPEPAHTWELTVRLATRKDMEKEGGSEGVRDAVLRPLVHVVDGQGLPRACPLLTIDRLRGADAGGRWVLAPSDAGLDPGLIRELVARALEGAGQVEARPIRATVEPGETAELRLVVNRPKPRPGEAVPARALVRVTDDEGHLRFSGEASLAGAPEFRTGSLALPAPTPLAPGLYHVEVEVPEAPFAPRTATTGFWVRDAALLTSGPRLTVSRDWLRSDGRVLPIVGTTYMASDVHRKFLFEPNPDLWERDFAQMARRGINLVRTGLWTAWSRAMLDPGAFDESALLALDAYVLTAARHRIPVCFTFFAFQPPAFGGGNPFLDPRALDGQRAFLTLIASRYRGVPWVHWDLINEPSYAPPWAIWSNRPVGDSAERTAWEEWVRKRHGSDVALLRDLWREPGDGLLDLPSQEDQGWAMIREGRKPRKAHDFALFSQDMVAGWAGRLREILRAASGDALVTLGQDEGGTYTRPAQQFLAESLDYTAIHTWWNNDDLLWDGVVTKVPEKPNLHQETGLMRLEDEDGDPWRSQTQAAALLERKVAYAFASRGAGAVEWAWNINPYQPIDNESVIGVFRPDGTAKAELRALTDAAAFFEQAAPWLDDFEADPLILVIPHARLFAARPGDLEGTKRVVRLLAECYGVVPTALSDQRLSAARLAAARLVIVPSPELLDEPAAGALLSAANAGARVLVTGAVEGDAYGRRGRALEALGVLAPSRPLAQHEPTPWGEGWATFDGLLGERLRASSARFDASAQVWHEPLPLEFAREPGPLANLLGAALKAAGIPARPSEDRVVARVLRAPRALLVVCINETAVAARHRVSIEGKTRVIPVPAGRARLVLFERGSGRVLVTTPGEPMGGARP
jgi:hypothetical protein